MVGFVLKYILLCCKTDEKRWYKVLAKKHFSKRNEKRPAGDSSKKDSTERLTLFWDDEEAEEDFSENMGRDTQQKFGSYVDGINITIIMVNFRLKTVVSCYVEVAAREDLQRKKYALIFRKVA